MYFSQSTMSNRVDGWHMFTEIEAQKDNKGQ